MVRETAWWTARSASAARRARARRSCAATAASWTTDKDGPILGLLAAEITARTGRDPGELYLDLTREFGEAVYERIDMPAAARAKGRRWAESRPSRSRAKELAGEPIKAVLTTAPGNGAPIGGVKVVAEQRLVRSPPLGDRGPATSSTPRVFSGKDHLRRIQADARQLLADTLAADRGASTA